MLKWGCVSMVSAFIIGIWGFSKSGMHWLFIVPSSFILAAICFIFYTIKSKK